MTREVKFRETERRMVIARDWGNGERELLVMGEGFQISRMKKF